METYCKKQRFPIKHTLKRMRFPIKLSLKKLRFPTDGFNNCGNYIRLLRYFTFKFCDILDSEFVAIHPLILR